MKSFNHEINFELKKISLCLGVCFLSSQAFADPLVPSNPQPATQQNERVEMSVPPPPAIPTTQEEAFVPPQNKPFTDAVRDQSLTPEEIIILRRMTTDAKKASVQKLEPAKPEIGMISVDMSPGSVPPIIRLAENEGSTLVFMDSNNEPWPIQKFVNFGPKIAKADIALDGGNVLTLETLSSVGSGSMVVFLKNLATPVSLTLLTGQRSIDYRLDIKIPKAQKQTEAFYSSTAADGSTISQTAASSSELIEALQNTVQNQNMKPIRATGADVMAWVKGATGTGKNLVIRTKGTLLSPAAIEGKKISSSDGTRVYEIRLSPVITIMLNGKIYNVNLDIPS